MSIFRRRQEAQHIEQSVVAAANQAASNPEVSGIEALETTLEPHLDVLSESWEHIYSAYRDRLRSGVGHTAIASELDDSISSGAMAPHEGSENPTQREIRRMKTRISGKQVNLLFSEALVSARMRAMGEVNPRKYPTYKMDAAIYDEFASPLESRTQDFESTWLVASDLHQTLFSEFLDVEEHSEPVISTIETFIRDGDENRVAFIDWLSQRDPEVSEDRILLRTLASHYESDGSALDPSSGDYLFDINDKPSEFTVGLALLEEGAEGESLRTYVTSIRKILAKHHVDTEKLTDTDLIHSHYEELPPEIKERLLGLSLALNRDLRDKFSSVIGKHRVKAHRIPTLKDLKAITSELHADTTKGVAKKRASKGRVTHNDVKDFVVTAGDLERTIPEYQFGKLVAGGHNHSLKLEELEEIDIEKMIERAAQEGGTEIAGLRQDIANALEDIKENPYIDGSKKTRGANDVKVQINQGDRNSRIAPTRSYAPFRNTSAEKRKFQSRLGRQLRITYVIAGETVAIEGIFTDHDAYERSLNQ